MLGKKILKTAMYLVMGVAIAVGTMGARCESSAEMGKWETKKVKVNGEYRYKIVCVGEGTECVKKATGSFSL